MIAGGACQATPIADTADGGSWLSDRAREEADHIKIGPSNVTGFCGNYSIDYLASWDISGCGVDDGGRLGAVETLGLGVYRDRYGRDSS